MFVINVLSSFLEMIAASGDAFIVWYEYDGNSAIIEKNLKISHVLGFADDQNFVR